ncbi:hypothetical protein GCM10023084_18130 [Streptomyces lacrimifluminis]|uniref:Uncharacterized protein n=1 Tax=Streptomyces lacrimifluminis TaxID=1500077 RepID=A0A917NL37_9ACTN|nr:hypothetical protein [Streptomyces lacrimifluminis]GGJ09337.1 hypothetical protein GCM10012282_02500 [Streptomyces lacrimifluminis]
MTQSGQGEEPSPRVAREGIVLPSDGGEPLLPGMTGGNGGLPLPGPAAPPTPAPNPTGGQAWGLPWGPDPNQAQDDYQAQAPARDEYQNPYQAPSQATGGWSAASDAQQHQQWGDQGRFQPQAQQQPEQQAPSAPAWNNDPGGSGGWAQQPGYDAQSAPVAPHSVPHAAHGAGAAPLPPAAPQYEQQAHQPYGQYGGAPLPPEGGASGPYAAGAGAPLPPAEDATQYIPPVPGTPGPVADPATQFLPPVTAHTSAPPHVNEAATQFLPPVGPGALPPQPSAEATTYLGRVPQAAPGGSDADATQYIPPVPGGSYGIPPGGADDRQPPSDFDNLFRSGPGAEAPAGATQQMPRIQPQQPAPGSYGRQAPYAAQQAPYGFRAPHDMDDERDGGGRRSRVAVIAALGVGIVVLGIGAGAMLSRGGGDSSEDPGNKTVAAASSAPEKSEAPAADPAKAQAVELDKLLADSNDSRDAVIKAVSDVKSCTNLGQAAADLRGAAQQRGELVTRLSTLAVDKLPEHAGLTDALTKAWQASQAADNHYAAWADQTAGKNGCKKGQARSTGQTQKGNQQSGIATEQKSRAAELWNAIARTYGLTERQSTQL